MKLYQSNKREKGIVTLISLLVLFSLTLALSAAILSNTGSYTVAGAAVKKHADYYYDVENSLGVATAWLQENSEQLVKAFADSEFNANFELGPPSVGSNEPTTFNVPTMLKMQGTNQSVIISNDDAFGTATFPTVDGFDAVASFNALDLGDVSARLIAVWARETEGFHAPIFRMDAVTGTAPDRGVHSFTYIYSNYVQTQTAGDPLKGFLGRDSVFIQRTANSCNSYKFSYNSGTNTWSPGAPRSNCILQTASAFSIPSKIFGNVQTNSGSITIVPPQGQVTGNVCEGGGCHSTDLPDKPLWDAVCTADQGDISIPQNGTLTLTATGDDPSQKCWRDITIAKNGKLILDSPDFDYHIRTVFFGSATSNIHFQPPAYDDKITLNVDLFDAACEIAEPHFKGNMMYSGNEVAPHQVQLNYLGNEVLRLIGRNKFKFCVLAPNAPVRFDGNFHYYGSALATDLEIKRSSRLHLDEDCDVATVTVTDDLQYYKDKASQRYR